MIQRRYFPENGRAEHLFKFSGQSIEQLREHRILVQSLEEWKTNAVSPPDALKVPLPRE